MKEKPDMVVAFAFGTFLAKDIFHSPNYWIAQKARMLAVKYGIPIITQSDISLFLEDDKKIKVFNAQKNPEKYISTLEIAQTATKLAREHGWKKAIVIATPQHHRRCMRDLKKVGFSCRYFWNITPAWGWYSSKSTQRWTRSPWLWWPREILLRLIPWWLYKKITT